MTVSLGGIPLSDELVLTEGQPEIGYSVRPLIGGADWVQIDAANGGRDMVLEGVNHWNYGQRAQIRALQAQGLKVELIHHLGTYQVYILDTEDLQLTRKVKNPIGESLCTGSITLREVL